MSCLAEYHITYLENDMNERTTSIRKDVFGKWVATTNIRLANQRQLKLTTCKRDNGALQTTASVAIVKDSKNGYLVETFEVFGDYMKIVYVSRPSRVTQKAVEEQQDIAMGYLPQVMESVKAFYAEKGIEV